MPSSFYVRNGHKYEQRTGASLETVEKAYTDYMESMNKVQQMTNRLCELRGELLILEPKLEVEKLRCRCYQSGVDTYQHFEDLVRE
jgi:phage-related protein